jgi:hypothetical protein
MNSNLHLFREMRGAEAKGSNESVSNAVVLQA